MQGSKTEEFIKKLNRNVYSYRHVIRGILLTLLIYLFFLGGAYYSCRGGTMHKLKCVAPEQIYTVNVCETNIMGEKSCRDFLVNDLDQFNEQFGHQNSSFYYNLT